MRVGRLNLFKNILFCGVLPSSLKKKNPQNVLCENKSFLKHLLEMEASLMNSIMNSIFSVNFFFVLLVLHRLFVFLTHGLLSCHIKIITETRLHIILEGVWRFKRFRWKSVKHSWPRVGDGSVVSFDLVWLEINHQINPQNVYLNC